MHTGRTSAFSIDIVSLELLGRYPQNAQERSFHLLPVDMVSAKEYERLLEEYEIFEVWKVIVFDHQDRNRLVQNLASLGVDVTVWDHSLVFSLTERQEDLLFGKAIASLASPVLV